ncbi:serine aminopeptidase domain-containing protein [Clostridioides sp. ZZV15-6598]|uniref:serine aminopeptidase domain-containing protein n=1 Tax=Clostridioides sp. ZZV15-6598 TaxID=2811501 RepID=UPI001D0F9380|nr:alpha/beta hydrolase [Clostridioides sp. ZZV15-6598]
MIWQHIKIPNGNTVIFCNTFITGKSSMNIIVTHTPIVTTLDLQLAYEPLSQYDVNVFAFDFSGTGKSGGNEKDFSRNSIVEDLDSVIAYIEKNYSSNIHLYGNAGIGGMFAQYYACTSNKLKSFAQFACVDYKNTSGVGYPYPTVKLLNFFLKLLPNFHIIVKPPKYKGYNEVHDNEFYKMIEQNNPNIWKNSTKVMNTMLECFVAQDSTIKNGVNIPTLVFKTLHDRYFEPEYFDSYYNSLNCKKKLVEIDDVHNSYYLNSEKFCQTVYEWFIENQ